MAGAIVAAAGIANAGTFTAVKTGVWSDATVWNLSPNLTPVEGTDYPGPSDTANIGSTYVVTVTTATPNAHVGILHLTSSANVLINSSVNLAIGSGDIDNSAVMSINGTVNLVGGMFDIKASYMSIDSGGTFEMSGNDPELKIEGPNGARLSSSTSLLVVTAPSTNPAVISGDGNLRGYSNGAEIRIGSPDTDDDYQLTLTGAIKGALEITRGAVGTAAFANQGLLEADANSGSVIYVNSLDSITDTATPCTERWVCDSDAVLQFGTSITSPALGSAFLVNTGGILTLDSGVYVTTNGAANGGGTYHPNFTAGTCP